ncbi:MAG TPA: hypothetical protein VM009_04135 [Terriglobales bacterium]|nr:hypothetical protein [Terriglobales bacterium]
MQPPENSGGKDNKAAPKAVYRRSEGHIAVPLLCGIPALLALLIWILRGQNNESAAAAAPSA